MRIITYFNSELGTKTMFLFKHYRLASAYGTVIDSIMRNIRKSTYYGFLSDSTNPMFWIGPHSDTDFIDRKIFEGQDLKYPMHSIGYFPRTQSYRLYYTADASEIDSIFDAKYWLLSQDFDNGWKLTRTIVHGIHIETTSFVEEQIRNSIPLEMHLPSSINISQENNSYTVGIRKSS